MTLDYSISGKVKIIMSDYINNILLGLPEDMDGESPTPAANYLFDINMSNPTLLDKEKREFFHQTVANSCSFVSVQDLTSKLRFPSYVPE
jgi:hypothetical protein